MRTQPLPGTKIEFVDHRLRGRLVADPQGNQGILAEVIVVRDRQTRRVISRTAYLRPIDGSGVEWTTDRPQALRPVGPITPDTHPQDRR